MWVSIVQYPGLIGAAVRSYCDGVLTDFIVEKLSRKNNGVFELEYRLVALVIPFFMVLMCRSLVHSSFQVWNWCAAYDALVCHLTFFYFGLASVPAITMTYGTLLLNFAKI